MSLSSTAAQVELVKLDSLERAKCFDDTNLDYYGCVLASDFHRIPIKNELFNAADCGYYSSIYLKNVT